jgi:hypothetical protein
MATLKEGTNVYLWIATNRPNQPGDDGSWSTFDPTILGSALKVSGSMTLQQMRPLRKVTETIARDALQLSTTQPPRNRFSPKI